MSTVDELGEIRGNRAVNLGFSIGAEFDALRAFDLGFEIFLFGAKILGYFG